MMPDDLQGRLAEFMGGQDEPDPNDGLNLEGRLWSFVAPLAYEQRRQQRALDERYTNYPFDAPPEHRPHYTLLQAQQRQAAETQRDPGRTDPVGRYAVQALPFGSLLGRSARQKYEAAGERYQANEYGDDYEGQIKREADASIIAGYEEDQKLQGLFQQQRPLTSTLASVQGTAQEALIGGGLTKVAAPGFAAARAGTGIVPRLAASAGETALTTATMPSLYAQGESKSDTVNFVRGMVLTKILGSLGNQAEPLAGQVPTAIGRRVGGAAIGAAAFPAEQQVADTATSLMDEVLPDALQFKTKYGTLGKVLRGDEGAERSLALEGLTGALFAAMRAPANDRKQAFIDNLQRELAPHGATVVEASPELQPSAAPPAEPRTPQEPIPAPQEPRQGTQTAPEGVATPETAQEAPGAVPVSEKPLGTAPTAAFVKEFAKSMGLTQKEARATLDKLEPEVVQHLQSQFEAPPVAPEPQRAATYAEPPAGPEPAPAPEVAPEAKPEPTADEIRGHIAKGGSATYDFPNKRWNPLDPLEPAPGPATASADRMPVDEFKRLVQGSDLAERDKKILSARADRLSFEEAGSPWGLSKQRVHQIEKDFLERNGLGGKSLDKLLFAEEAGVAKGREEMKAPTHDDVKQSSLDQMDVLRNDADELEKRGHTDEARVMREEIANLEQDHEEHHADLTRAAETAGRSAADVQRRTDEALSAALANAGAAPQGAVPAVERPTPAQIRQRLSGLIGGGSEGEGEPQRRVEQTALANEVADRERAQHNLPPLMKSARQSNPETWDRAMAALDADPNASRRLTEELAAKPRATTVEENALLLHRKITLTNELRQVATEATAMFHPDSKGQFTDEQIAAVERRYDDVMAQADQLDKVARATGTEWGRAGQFRRQLAAEDYSLASMLLGRRMAKGSDLTAQERQQIVDLNKRIEELQTKLAAADTQPDRIALKKALGEFTKIIEGDKDRARPIISRVFSRVGEAINLSRSIITSLDLSAVLRQGGFTAFSRPLTSLRAIPESIRAFASKGAAERAADDLAQRPNAKAGLYERAGLYLADTEGGLSKQEESFMSKWAGKIPLVAGSERAYTTFLNRIRADVFDSMIGAVGKNGRVTEGEAKALANFVNVSTGRGGLGPLEKSAVPLAHLFFSPRYLASRFQLIAGQPLIGGSGTTRKAIAAEYGKALIGLGVFYGALKLAGGDDVDIEADPRSSDFGKVRIGRSRIDPLTGLAQIVTAASRLATGGTKNAEGVVVPTRGEYAGQTSPGDIITRFVRGKLSPLAGAAVDITAGKDAVGEPVTAKSVATNLTVPFSVRDVYQSMTEQGMPTGPALSLLALLGMGVQTYGHEASPGSRSLAEVRELKRRYLISHGRPDEAAPHQSGIGDLTSAVRDNDQAAFTKAWQAYVARGKAMGKSPERFEHDWQTAASHVNPLVGLSEADRNRFVGGLTADQRTKVKVATDHSLVVIRKMAEMRRQAK